MRNPRMILRSAIGIAVAAIAATLCYVAIAAEYSADTKPTAVDAAQYADLFGNEVFDMQDLAEGAEIQRRFFNRITPPGFSWLQPMFPPVVPFDATNFDDSFLDALLGEDKNSVAIYPLSLSLDPNTRETLVYNADGKLIATVPADKIFRSWPEDADPARVTLQLNLLPAEDVEPYLYTESRVKEFIASAAKIKSAKVGGPAQRNLGASEFGICNIQKLTNGNMRLTLTNGTDAAEVYSYTVLHTSSVVVVTWTNEQSNVVTDTNTLWTPVSPSFNGLESAWACAASNLALTNGVGVWEDANISSNARVRFYGVANLMSSDEDGLTDGAEIFLYRTDPDNSDTDEDGLSDGTEVNIYGTNPNNSDTDGDGLPDAWEVQYGFDPLDDGTIDPDNGPGGDSDEDGFDNALELELGAPPNNPAWNGQELAYRLTHAHSVTNTRSITTNLIGMRVDIEDSANCGGSNNGRQNKVDPFNVPDLLDCGYYIDITVEGAVEDQNDYYDQVHFEAYTNTYFFEGSENYNGCSMTTKTVTRNVLILPNSTVGLRYDTMSYKYHVGAYAEIIGAALTGEVKAGIVLPSENIQTCCRAEERVAYATIEGEGDGVEIEQVIFSSTPGGLTFEGNGENPTEVTIKNIKWFPGGVVEPCDRKCVYQISVDVYLSNGTICSATKPLIVEAELHSCNVRDNHSIEGDPEFESSPIFNGNCATIVAMGGDFRWEFDPSSPICNDPEPLAGCYFINQIMAEELYHQGQYESFNENPPPELDMDDILDDFNYGGNNTFCADSDFQRKQLAEIELRRIANERFQDQMHADLETGAGPLRCRLELEAKTAALSSYFYTYECTYADLCGEQN